MSCTANTMIGSMDSDSIKKMDSDSIKKYLFNIAMKSEWEEVVKAYEQNNWARQAKITKSGDTALHLAVLDGQEKRIEKLVNQLVSEEELKIQNERGNTPLHFAAAQGNVRMCKCIAKKNPSLVGILNKDGETPLFLAALHGKKDAFLCLHYICTPNKSDPKYYNYCRRKDGNTILHCAISGEYFDLAFQIIALYEDLVIYVNEVGFSPLHLLASKPSAFESSSHRRTWTRIIYHCILVDELNVEEADHFHERVNNTLKNYEDREDPEYPENYKTCINFLLVFWKMARVSRVFVTQKKVDNGKCRKKSTNPENPKKATEGNTVTQKEVDNGKCRKESADPENTKEATEGNSGPYSTCFNFVKLLSKAMLIVTFLPVLFWKMARLFVTQKEVDNEKCRKESTDPENPKEATEGNTVTQKEVDNGKCRKEPADPVNSKGATEGNSGLYSTCFNFVKLLSKAMLIVLGLVFEGSTQIQKIRIKKEKHKWAVQIMEKLLKSAAIYQYEDSGMNPEAAPITSSEDGETKPYKISDGGDRIALGSIEEVTSQPTEQEVTSQPNQQDGNKGKGVIKEGSLPPESTEKIPPEMEKKETPILIAAKNGVTEMVEKILEHFPMAIHDLNADKKNIVLLAVEHRQPRVYQLLLKRKITKESVFSKVDKDGNSALHLAAWMGEYNKPWLIPGAALQMQWEIKWYEFVKNSMPVHFFVRYNNESKTARDIFTKTHEKIIEDGGKWLNTTSQSCSVVAALVATVAFATATTVPGGINQDNGRPTLENQPAFDIFAIASLVALCFSVTSMVMFLAILTSRYQEKDFGKDLPRKLLWGLTSLFLSITSMLISFCAGHFFVLKDKLKYAAVPVYAVSCLPVSFFALAQFPLYVDLVWATLKKVPQRSYRVYM